MGIFLLLPAWLAWAKLVGGWAVPIIPILVGCSVLIGGWFFAGTYRRTRSLALVSIEHALDGQLVFTIGLGEFFYGGTVQALGG